MCFLLWCQNTKITISCWTTIVRRMLGTTKKYTPNPKTKQKPQQDGRRGTIMIKSNPICLSGGWPTNWRTIIPKNFSHCCEGSDPHIRLSSLWGSSKGTGNPQEIWLWRTAGFNYRTSTGLRETDFTFGRHRQTLELTKTQGTWAVTPQETEPDILAGVGGSSVEVWAGSDSPRGWGHWNSSPGKCPSV